MRVIVFSHWKVSVIGWYRQRRNTDQQMSFREKLIHEKLQTALSNPHMIFVLLTPSKVTASGSTHRMEYAAFISRSRSVDPLTFYPLCYFGSIHLADKRSSGPL